MDCRSSRNSVELPGSFPSVVATPTAVPDSTRPQRTPSPRRSPLRDRDLDLESTREDADPQFFTPNERPRASDLARVDPPPPNTMTNSSGTPDVAQSFRNALWKLKLPVGRFDGNPDDVQDFLAALRGEATAAVAAGYIRSPADALTRISKYLVGPALQWYYNTGAARSSDFDGFCAAFQDAFGSRSHGALRKHTVLAMSCQPGEKVRMWAIRLQAASSKLPTADQLPLRELKSTFLNGMGNANLQHIAVDGKSWDDSRVSFEQLVNKVTDKWADAIPTERLLTSDLSSATMKQISDVVGKQVQQMSDVVCKDLKEELRLTNQSARRPPVPRVFQAEVDDWTADDQLDFEMYLTERRSFRNGAARGALPGQSAYPRPPYQSPYRPTQGYHSGYPYQTAPYDYAPQQPYFDGYPPAPPAAPAAPPAAPVDPEFADVVSQLSRLWHAKDRGQRAPSHGRSQPPPRSQGGEQSPSDQKDFANRA